MLIKELLTTDAVSIPNIALLLLSLSSSHRMSLISLKNGYPVIKISMYVEIALYNLSDFSAILY